MTNNYRVVEVRDCIDNDILYFTILLNNKHTIKEFQNEINRIKREKADEIYTYGNDWEIISENISKDFDWRDDLDTDEDYLVF